MRIFKERESVPLPFAPTVRIPTIPQRRPPSRRYVIALIVLLIFDALVALPLGWAVAASQQKGSIPSRSSRFQVQLPSSILARGVGQSRTPLPDPGPSLSQETWVDTFHRPDQPYWGSATGGGSWIIDASPNRAFAVVDQAGLISAGGGTFTAQLGPRLADTELMVTFSISKFNGQNNMGVILHWEDTAHWYKLYLDGVHLALIKRDGAQILQLGSVSFPAQAAVRYTLLVQVRGTVFLVKAWSSAESESSAWEMGVTDPSPSWFAGYGGVRVYYVGPARIATTVTYFREKRIAENR